MNRSIPPLLGDDGALVTRRLRVQPRDVVFVKGVIEASEGLAAVFAESGGELTIASPRAQEPELDRVLRDLAEETGGLLERGAGETT